MLNKTDYIASLAKGLRVIEAFSAEQAQLSITQVAQIAGLDRATARRCLLTLHSEGYATYDGKYFALAPRALRLGLGALDSLALPKIVQPWLDQLSQRIGQSCSVSVLDERDIVYLARASQRRVMSIGLMPGSRLPAHCSSMGRVLLAALSVEQARQIVEQSDLSPRTPHSLTRVEDVLAHIARVKEQGYAISDQEIELGLRSIAVPLFNARGDVVAALNTGMAATHAQANELADEFLPALLEVQEGLKRLL